MRAAQPKGLRGSLKWIQAAVSLRPDLLQPAGLKPVEWVSPIESDAYAEYRDEAFLELLGLEHFATSLADFWPRRGPQWDALGLTEDGCVLVEAKAHVGEFFTPPSAAGATSQAKIARAFEAVRIDLGIETTVPWDTVFYQYANRIAHLWWLRQMGVDAKLLFVSFLDDDEMGGPAHAETWQAVFSAADYVLGLSGRHALKPHILHVMPSVRDIPG